MIRDRSMTLGQRAALTKLFRFHPEGVVLNNLATTTALVERGFAERRTERRPHWVGLTKEGLDWCLERGW